MLNNNKKLTLSCFTPFDTEMGQTTHWAMHIFIFKFKFIDTYCSPKAEVKT